MLCKAFYLLRCNLLSFENSSTLLIHLLYTHYQPRVNLFFTAFFRFPSAARAALTRAAGYASG